jgi:formylglycine-generating enzyme required for sulfatase activity
MEQARSVARRRPESMTARVPANHPVWGVSQEEARAYALWLSDATGRHFRLPNEEDWEHAARGPAGHEFPFGDTFDARCCNTAEAGIGHTTPVDRYASFASELGVIDLAGRTRSPAAAASRCSQPRPRWRSTSPAPAAPGHWT